MDPAVPGEVTEDRIAEDLDGGIDVPTGETDLTDVDGSPVEADTADTVDEEKSAEDEFVDEERQQT
jgi:hypothetical protein